MGDTQKKPVLALEFYAKEPHMGFGFRTWPYGFLLTLLLVIPWVLLASSDVSGQSTTWTRQFGTSWPDLANDVATDEAGNVFLVGQTSGVLPGQSRQGGFSDAYLRKYDGEGNELWTRQFGGQGDDAAQDVAADDSGNVYVVGNTAGNFPSGTIVGGISGAFLRKYSSDGAELWDRQFGVENFASANGLDVDIAGNVYVAGQAEGALPGQIGAGFNDAFLRRYDSEGQLVWTVQFGAEGGDFATDVAVDGKGHVYVVGWSRGERPGRLNAISIHTFVHKFDGDGQELWARQLDAEGFDRATGVVVDSQGNAYVVGWISGVLPGQVQSGATDAFLAKYEADGQLSWARQFGTPDEERAVGIGIDGGGSLYLVGWTRGVFPNQTALAPRSVFVRKDAFVRKYDREGNEVWTRQFFNQVDQNTNQLDQSANGVASDAAGNMYIVGHTASPLLDQPRIGGIDAFVVKMDGGPPIVSAVPPATTSPIASAAPPATTSPTVSTVPPATTSPTASAAPDPTTPSAAPTDNQAAPTPLPTPIPSSGGGCSAPANGGGGLGIGWILFGLFLPGLLLVKWTRR